ncbi:variant surface glycoprotein (VSG), putative, (fragment) [Trypanosoma vivax Y486]|uniref:Variant surface glycoprotein (VSG), putative n=1 Tax=Trypanosoma vivax (strain Y486) TaxID=1055687 RepID=F9WNA1_TRYVY
MIRKDIAAALAEVRVTNVTTEPIVNEARKNNTLMAAEMLKDGAWDGSATLVHAVALAKQAIAEWEQVAPHMERAKRAANKGLYALNDDSADKVTDLQDGPVSWEIPSTPATQAISAKNDSGWKFNTHSCQALSADITCLCPSAGQSNECIRISSSGNVISTAVNGKANAVAAWKELKKYCISSMRGRATQGSILASIAHLKAMLGTNTASGTTGTHVIRITHALGQQHTPTDDKNGIKFVTYGAYAASKIPWEVALIEAGSALDKARRLAEHATHGAELALGLMTAWTPQQRD